MNQVPSIMQAIVIEKPGGPDVLIPVERAAPRPGDGEIMVKVAAAGVNRPDVLQREGLYAPPPGASDLPGLEVAGEVAAVGPNVTRWRLGDKICALTPGGGYAAFACVHESNALPVPPGLSMIEAAALPEAFFTVWHNVFERGALKAGETLLVHGGSSGIGTTAIMMAKALEAKVIATTGSLDKCAECMNLGAEVAIDRTKGDWLKDVEMATKGHGADVILDMVGGPYVEKNYQAAALDGRIVQIAFLQGARVPLDLGTLMAKRLTHTGSTMRPQSIAAKAKIARALEAMIWPLLAAGQCRPVIHAVFPLLKAAEAHCLMEKNSHFGKIVLKIQ